jgi:hypothetical protein
MLVIARVGHGQEKSDEDLAKATQNPLASMISLPFQNNTNFGIGPDDDIQNVLNIQPVWPFFFLARTGILLHARSFL